MIQQLNCHGRTLRLQLSRRAHRQLAARSSPLFVQMTLLIDDLVRKELQISEEGPIDLAPYWIGNHLALVYRPLISAGPTPGGKLDLPVKHWGKKFPRWLRLEHNGTQFFGDFGLNQPQPVEVLPRLLGWHRPRLE
ncbi:MAG: hypothetical protein RRB13_00150 [bacterium]|nr:hypothetical protein [bacterium]